MPTPEETRDRILGQLTAIIEVSEKKVFQAPEVRISCLRSNLYAFMLVEFAACERAVIEKTKKAR